MNIILSSLANLAYDAESNRSHPMSAANARIMGCVSEKEYFIDLLFFNRRLQALIAIELKRGEFKPEYAGKLNFYLSALDEYVKLPHENPSIGIILCKDRDSKTVEFAFRDINKPMGVATYRTSSELPKEYQGILPEPEELRKLM